MEVLEVICCYQQQQQQLLFHNNDNEDEGKGYIDNEEKSKYNGNDNEDENKDNNGFYSFLWYSQWYFILSQNELWNKKCRFVTYFFL